MKNKIITDKISTSSMLALFAILPLTASAFWDFCISLPYTILAFILGWPTPIMYEILPEAGGKSLYELGFAGLFIFGFLIDLAVVVLIGLFIDRKRAISKQSVTNRCALKLPVYFFLLVVVLFLWALVDRSC